MAVKGFDFGIDELGDLIIDSNTFQVKKMEGNDLRVQLAYTRLKSIANNWFYDYVGADMEELVGKAIKSDVLNLGSEKIINVLTFDDLWDEKDIFIQTNVKDSTHVIYSVYLRQLTNDEYGEKSIEITVTLDLVKGVNINYGWK